MCALTIKDISQIQPYAFPGGYPILYVINDRECACAACARLAFQDGADVVAGILYEATVQCDCYACADECINVIIGAHICEECERDARSGIAQDCTHY